MKRGRKSISRSRRRVQRPRIVAKVKGGKPIAAILREESAQPRGGRTEESKDKEEGGSSKKSQLEFFFVIGFELGVEQ